MKTRIILLIAVSAIATLSFTIASVNDPRPSSAETKVATTSEEPVGGLQSETGI